jgi:hypothetical protein
MEIQRTESTGGIIAAKIPAARSAPEGRRRKKNHG